MSQSRSNRVLGMTGIDCLTVMTCAAFLLAAQIPFLSASREAARRMACRNNLKQFGIGLHIYHDVWKSLPPGSNRFAGKDYQDDQPHVGWQVRVLPQMEQQPLYDKVVWKMDEKEAGPYSPVLMPKGLTPMHKIQVPYARCPSDSTPQDGKTALANYTGNVGSQYTTSADEKNCNPYTEAGKHFEQMADAKGQDVEAPYNNRLFGDTFTNQELSGVFSRKGVETMNFECVTDGTSNVLMAGENLPNCIDSGVRGWAFRDGSGNAHASTSVPINTLTTCAKNEAEAAKNKNPFPTCFDQTQKNLSWGFRSRHPDGAQFVYCDGSVHFLTEKIDYTTYQRLGGRRDGKELK